MVISFGAGPMPVAAEDAATGPVTGRGAAANGQAFGDHVELLLGAWFGGTTPFEAVVSAGSNVDRARPARSRTPDLDASMSSSPDVADEDATLPVFVASVADQTAWTRPSEPLAVLNRFAVAAPADPTAADISSDSAASSRPSAGIGAPQQSSLDSALPTPSTFGSALPQSGSDGLLPTQSLPAAPPLPSAPGSVPLIRQSSEAPRDSATVSTALSLPMAGINVELDANPVPLPVGVPPPVHRETRAGVARALEHSQGRTDASIRAELPALTSPDMHSQAPPPGEAQAHAVPADDAPEAGAATDLRVPFAGIRPAGRSTESHEGPATETSRPARVDIAVVPSARAVVSREGTGEASRFDPPQEDARPSTLATPTVVQPPLDSPTPLKPVAELIVRDAVPGAAPAQTEEPALADQIVQSLRLQLTNGGGEAQLRLRPEYLGELTVRVVVENGVVSARLEAAAPAVREWVERHEGVLRQALSEHGLSLETLSVHESTTADDANPQFDRDGSHGDHPEDERPRRRRRAQPAAGAFTVDTGENDHA